MTKSLAPDTYSRRERLGPTSRQHGRDGLVFGILIVASLGLVVMNRFDQPFATYLRSTIQDVSTPLLRGTAAVVAPVLRSVRMFTEVRELSDETVRLRDENARLRGWEARAKNLEQQSAALLALARAADEPRLVFITARVVSGQGGPFARAVLIESGREQGVKQGYPVISARGLAGRIVAVGAKSARLLLVTDHNSRIPVSIGVNAARAVMQGDNGAMPKIAYLPAGSNVRAGDDVFTSGIGGLFPRGLRVGTVVDTGDALRIEPSTPFDHLDFVSVLFFDTIDSAVSEEERAAEARVGVARRTGAGALRGEVPLP